MIDTSEALYFGLWAMRVGLYRRSLTMLEMTCMYRIPKSMDVYGALHVFCITHSVELQDTTLPSHATLRTELSPGSFNMLFWCFIHIRLVLGISIDGRSRDEMNCRLSLRDGAIVI